MLGLISRPSQNSRILLLSKPAGAARAVGVEKQSLVRNACLAERADDFGHAFLDLEQVAVVARHGLGAGQRDALAVGQKEHIRCLAFLSSLVGNLLAAPPGGCVAAVQLHAGHVQLGLVDLQQRLPHALPRVIPAPFIIVIVHCFPSDCVLAKPAPHGQLAPLTARLDAVCDRTHNPPQADFTFWPALSFRQVRNEVLVDDFFSLI